MAHLRKGALRPNHHYYYYYYETDPFVNLLDTADGPISISFLHIINTWSTTKAILGVIL